MVQMQDDKFLQNANVLKSALTEQGYKISEADASIILFINGERLNQKQGNLFLVKHKIDIKLLDENGEIFSSNTVEEIGSSVLSFEDASLNTGNELKERLKKVGFRKYVGIEQ